MMLRYVVPYGILKLYATFFGKRDTFQGVKVIEVIHNELYMMDKLKTNRSR